MKIQLVSAPFLSLNRSDSFQYSLGPPLGIMYLASYLRKYYPQKIDLKLTDGVLLGREQTVKEVLRFRPDILGISILTPNSLGGYCLANQIKKALPKTFIIFGGVHTSALPEEVFRLSKADLVVVGEGEQTLLEIVTAFSNERKHFEKIKDFAEMPGLAIKKSGKILRTSPREFIQNLDRLPFPAQDLLEHRELYRGWVFKKSSPETVIMSTRGCPFHCFFCTDVIWKSAKPHLRMRSPKNIADELEWLVKEYGIKEYFDVADEFNCRQSWAIAVCKEIAKRKLGLTWKCQLRADQVSDELARNLARAGCWYVCLGVESGNQKTLDGIGKKITLPQVEKACRILKKHGFKINLLLMLFNIWEEKGQLAYEGVRESLNTLNYGRRLIGKGLADFLGPSPTMPYPGSPLYEFSLKHKVIPEKIIGQWEKWNNVWGAPLNLPKITPSDYIKVKALAVGLQTWCFLTRMNQGVNLRTVDDYAKRVLGVFSLFFKLIKSKLTNAHE